MTRLDDPILSQAGLFLQGVLSSETVALPEGASGYSQLIVLAHAGPAFWQYAMSGNRGADPLDSASINLAHDLMARVNEDDYKILYPTDHLSVDLMSIGRALGWQHHTPMGVGIHPEFGTWFAYRAVIAANTSFELTAEDLPHPCDDCSDKPCVIVCPAHAVKAEGFDLAACSSSRVEPESSCASRCLSRLSCPVGIAYQYESDQVRYHYDRSLQAIIRYTEQIEGQSL